MPDMPTLCQNCRKEEATEEFRGYQCCDRCYTQAQLPAYMRD